MKLRPLYALLSLVAGCASLDGLAGGAEQTLSDPCASADAPRCDHGRCIAESGGARCACDDGWSGSTCAECTPGRTCPPPTCATTTCAPHAVCDETSGAPTCNCAAGYELRESACVWKGVVFDPGFENKPQGAWTLPEGVQIDPNGVGRDPGLVELNVPQCSYAKTHVVQSITMPAITAAEPLALDLTSRSVCTSPFPGREISCYSPVSVILGGRGIEPFSFVGRAGVSRRVCLGERAFGGKHDLRLATNLCGGLTTSVMLDHAEIVPEPKCPPFGKVTNAGFEENGGWEVAGTGAEVAAAIGHQGSRGGRLHHAKRCDGPILNGAISVRTSEPAKPALTFTAKGTSGRTMTVRLDGITMGTVTGTAVYEKVSLCLPEYAKGMAQALSFSASDDRPGANCGDVDDYEFIVDELAIEGDASCPDAAPIVDGGFERADTKRYWTMSTDGGSVVFPKGTGANSGAGYATLSQSACERATNLGGSGLIPAAKPGSGGPALVFWYKAAAANAITYSGPSGDLAPTTTWTRALQCLPPYRAGFMYPFAFAVGSGASCQSGSLSIDDIQFTNDVACPEQ